MMRAALVVGIAALAFGPRALAFDFEDVAKRASALAAQSYKAPAVELPKAVKDLSYDEYRDIRFKPARSLWRATNLPFEVQLFHPGLYYDKPVRISEIVGGAAREIRFDPELFDYGKNKLDKATLRNIGFAGFRVPQGRSRGRDHGGPAGPQDPDRAIDLAARGAHELRAREVVVGGAVGKVEADDVDAGREHPLEDFRRARRGAEGCDDLRAADRAAVSTEGHQARALSSSAATAGSFLPSRNSRKAPPPVEM